MSSISRRFHFRFADALTGRAGRFIGQVHLRIIAVDAAKRTDSDCAEKILLHDIAPMRPKYLRAATMWTDSFGVSLHSLQRIPDSRLQRLKSSPDLQHG
jgi:hypothetical protein